MTYIAARPTTYRGIKMRSRLEAHVASWLDREPFEGRWQYEPQAFANEHGQYLPDFYVDAPNGPMYIEVRPTLERGFLAMERMQIIWDSDPSAILLLLVSEDGEFGVGLTATSDDRMWRLVG